MTSQVHTTPFQHELEISQSQLKECKFHRWDWKWYPNVQTSKNAIQILHDCISVWYYIESMRDIEWLGQRIDWKQTPVNTQSHQTSFLLCIPPLTADFRGITQGPHIVVQPCAVMVQQFFLSCLAIPIRRPGFNAHIKLHHLSNPRPILSRKLPA